MVITHNHEGYVISGQRDNGTLFTRLYCGYNKRDAISEFRSDLRDENGPITNRYGYKIGETVQIKEQLTCNDGSKINAGQLVSIASFTPKTHMRPSYARTTKESKRVYFIHATVPGDPCRFVNVNFDKIKKVKS